MSLLSSHIAEGRELKGVSNAMELYINLTNGFRIGIIKLAGNRLKKIIFGGECHHFKKVFAFPAPDVVYCYLWAEQGGGKDNRFGGDSSTNSIEAG